MKLARKLVRDERGVGAVEFAIALPPLMMMIYGVFLIGQVYEAEAIMQNAIGEGARYATLCLNPTSTGVCTIPTDAQISTKVQNKLFGPVGALLPSVSSDTTNKTKTISLTYTRSVPFLWMTAKAISITRSKTVYYSS